MALNNGTDIEMGSTLFSHLPEAVAQVRTLTLTLTPILTPILTRTP